MIDSVSMSWKTSSVAQALAKGLSALRGENAPLVIPYGSNSDTLWTLDSPRLQERLAGAAKNGLILIWDGPTSPSSLDGRDTAEHLNPLTWGLCALRRFPDLKLAVLDCDSGKHLKGEFYRVIQALDPAQLFFRLLTKPCCCVADCLAYLQERRKLLASTTVMDLLTHQMRAILTERRQEGNHHALANIVGPLILVGEHENLVTRGPQQSLATLFKSVGLITQRKSHQKSDIRALVPSATGAATATTVEKDLVVRILLVDDQWTEGWDRWVEKMLVGRPQYRLERMDSPDSVVSAIERVSSEERLDKETNFGFALPAGQRQSEEPTSSQDSLLPNVGEDTIVLLDLRLFSTRSSLEEAGFVRNRLLPLCRHFQRADGGDTSEFHWPGFNTDELMTVETWCANPVRETDEYLLVLSLLPRLLALTDFSLPIVLFSSTGQRRIMELLKPYGTIITDFEKPRFTGLEAADLVARTEDSFASAMGKAESLLAARRHCRSILDSPTALACVAPFPEWDKTRYVELFLDEGDWTHHGATHYAVGGCFAVFDAPTLRDARTKADCFDDALVRRGIRYFESRGVGIEPPNGKLLRKGENIASRFDNWRTEEAAPVCLGALRMRIEKGQAGARTGSLANLESADNRYFLALKSLLELFFCESVPALAGSGDPGAVVVSVFPAAKTVFVKADHQDNAMTNYGLKVAVRSKGLFFSLDRSYVYPLVDDILDSHGIRRRTGRLLAPQLPYSGAHTELPEFFLCSRCNRTVEIKGSVSIDELHRDLRCTCKEASFRPDYRALHYLADEMLSQFPDGQKHRLYDAVFPVLIPGEFDEVWDKELASTLTASRCLDADDFVGALASFEPPSPIGKKPRASTWLQRRLLARIPSMTGEEFLRLANRLDAGRTHQRGART